MGRSRVTPITQKDEYSCGPTALKTALKILDVRASLSKLIALSKPSKRNGTSIKNLLRTIKTFGLHTLAVEYSTLAHIKAALKTSDGIHCAVMLTYIYDLEHDGKIDPENGHWATVSGYKSDLGRIVLFDSYTGKRKSYPWQKFRYLWRDYEYKRHADNKTGRTFKLVKKWMPQFMLIIARSKEELPTFRTPYAKYFAPDSSSI